MAQLGVEFTVQAADIDETLMDNERPERAVSRLASAKAERIAMAPSSDSNIILGADTIVVKGEEILGKPHDADDARRMLGLLSGTQHTVLSAIAFASHCDGSLEVDASVVTTTVHFRVLSGEETEAYIATQEPFDKAGAYGIQGLAAAFVTRIEGSYSNVVGLPLAETWAKLVSLGVKTALS